MTLLLYNLYPKSFYINSFSCARCAANRRTNINGLGRRKIVKFIFIFMAWLCFRHWRRLPRPCACVTALFFIFFLFPSFSILVSWQHFSFAVSPPPFSSVGCARLNVCTFLFGHFKNILCPLFGPFLNVFFFLGTFAACHAAHLYANACVYWHSLTVATPLYAIYVLFSVPFMSTSFFWFIGPTVFHIAAHFTFRPFAPFAGQQMFAVLLVNLKCIKWATHHRKRCRVAVFHSRICSVFRSVFFIAYRTHEMLNCANFIWTNTPKPFR